MTVRATVDAGTPSSRPSPAGRAEDREGVRLPHGRRPARGTTRAAGSTRARSPTSATIEPDEHVTVMARGRRAPRQHTYPTGAAAAWPTGSRSSSPPRTTQLSLTFFDKRSTRRVAAGRSGPGRTGLFSGKVGTFRGSSS